MSDSASSLTRTIARQYDLFQASLEFLQKERKFLNYGYTVSGKETILSRPCCYDRFFGIGPLDDRSDNSREHHKT
jgi:hypothetical protein